ncbi:MAG: helix-turn-helix transcriptional regulator [Bacteroidota bacterium]
MLLESVGQTIKERRKQLHITQPTLAELAEVSKNTIYKLERGLANPSIKVLHQILEVLGMELAIQVKTVEP